MQLTLSGTINAERRDIQGTTTVNGIAGQGTFRAQASAQDQALYDVDSSFAAISGRYQDIRTGTLIDVTIAADGSITDNNSNCTITGDVVLAVQPVRIAGHGFRLPRVR
ncbi:MAG: hypothetical protein U5Q16_10355 [Gammaproteobacteria bacterium]|nr:hypothetical protein [Gammaproteobacteria bacterium]